MNSFQMTFYTENMQMFKAMESNKVQVLRMFASVRGLRLQMNNEHLELQLGTGYVKGQHATEPKREESKDSTEKKM